ncbi:hypothetical protein ACF0H5_011001 [Mactra antiquata]
MERNDDQLLFGIVDYSVFGSIIFASLLLGVFFAVRDKKKNTADNYFLGNKKQKALPLSISYVVTFMSSVIFLGTPAEIYLYGIQYFIQLFGVSIGFVLAAVIVVPLYHPLGVTSCYEYYYLRYGSHEVRYLGVTFGALFYVMYMGIVLNGAALALQSTAGLPTWMTIVIFSTASITYTSLGGIKAVIWTDVLQSVIMLAGIITVLIKILKHVGGVDNLADIGDNRLQLFDFNPDPTVRHTFWTLTLGAVPHFFYAAITQAGVQRILSTPNVTTARRIMYFAAPIYCLTWTLSMFVGISVFAYFKAKRCDPLASGQITNSNQIMPYVILELFQDYPGVPGLFIAALAAASLSTVSSGLSGLAAVASMDILRVAKPDVTDTSVTYLSKIFVVAFGLISVMVAFVLSNVKGPLGQIMSGFAGAVAGPETGMFLVSVFFRKSRPRVLVMSALLSFLISMWIILGQTFSPGVRPNPYLPLAPTDKCPLSGNFSSNDITTYNSTVLPTAIIYTPSMNPISSEVLTTTYQSHQALNVDRSNLDIMYSISYMYICMLGILITVLVAIPASLVCQPKEPENVNEKCVLPLSVLLPSFLKKYQSSNQSNKQQNDNSEDPRDTDQTSV